MEGASVSVAVEILEGRGFDELPVVAFIPGPAGVDLAVIAFAGRIVEELVDEARRGRDFSDAEAAACPCFPAQP